MLTEVLKQQGEIGVETLQNALAKKSVTGDTVNSVRFESDQTKLKLFAREYIETLEDGRGPRKASAYGGFDKGLEKYLEAKGFATKTSKKGNKYYLIGQSWVTAKGLAHKINKEGDKLYRAGGGKDVYSKALAKFTIDLTKAVKNDQIKEFKNDIVMSLKGI
jgi:hypothetical protein